MAFKKSSTQAIKYLKKCIKKHHYAEAEFKLAQIMLKKLRKETNDESHAKKEGDQHHQKPKFDKNDVYGLIISAAKKGLAEAQFAYFQMLDAGEGIAKDQTAAVAYLKNAAAQENEDAIQEIAQRYKNGGFGLKNLLTKPWNASKIAKKNKTARFELEQLLKDLTPSSKKLNKHKIHKTLTTSSF